VPVSEVLWDHFCTHLTHVKIYSYDFPNCVSVNVVLPYVSFVCKCVLDYCHPDIRAFTDYPKWGLSVLFPRLYGKCQGITRKDGGRPALPNFFLFIMYFPFSVFCVLFVCKCVLHFCHWLSTKLQLKLNNNSTEDAIHDDLIQYNAKQCHHTKVP
jgi:hypothetical protein